MNEKEKKQIKDFEYWVNTNNEKGVCSIPDYICNRVLNLIDKQNKELNKLKSKNKELLRKLRNRVKENNKLIKYSNYKKEFSTLNKQIDKQNKVIEEMSTTIIKERRYRNIDEHPEWIENTKRFFFKKVENDERREKFLRKVEEDDKD